MARVTSSVCADVCSLRYPYRPPLSDIDVVGKYDYIHPMARPTQRKISWIKAALKDFGKFPEGARLKAQRALTVVAEGSMPDVAKPLVGLGQGVWELAIKERGDAYRVVYALQIADAMWVVHAFQKKSVSGIATPKHEIDLVRDRIKRLKENMQ